MNIFRNIKKLLINSTVFLKFSCWKIDGFDLDKEADVLFPDGLISINSSSKAIIQEVQSDLYAQLVNNGQEIIEKNSLKEGDIFSGRLENYLLFRDGNLKIKSKTLEVDCNQFNISCNSININVSNIVINNNINLSFVGDKISINGKEIAVLGGTVNLTTGIINNSGQ